MSYEVRYSILYDYTTAHSPILEGDLEVTAYSYELMPSFTSVLYHVPYGTQRELRRGTCGDHLQYRNHTLIHSVRE